MLKILKAVSDLVVVERDGGSVALAGPPSRHRLSQCSMCPFSTGEKVSNLFFGTVCSSCVEGEKLY